MRRLKLLWLWWRTRKWKPDDHDMCLSFMGPCIGPGSCTERLEIESDYGGETEPEIRDAVEEALRSLGEVGIRLTHIPEKRPVRMVPRRDDMVMVHADGGDCHGTRLVNRVCPKCGICPDMQSIELWPPEEAK